MKDKYREAFFYLFFGGIAFFLNIGLFYAIDRYTVLDSLINNAICWVICVLFQFITNRLWVFQSKKKTVKAFLWEMGTFFGGRIFTLLVEEGILYIGISCLNIASFPVKIGAQVVVILLNFIISKWIVFKK